VAEDSDENAAGDPGAKPGEPEGLADAAPPEISEGMQNKPVNGHREIEKENNQRHIPEESHEAS
jgi:hypothetical protein